MSNDKREKDCFCDDTCDECLYICEGDFICSITNEIVIEDWIPVKGECDKKKVSH